MGKVNSKYEMSLETEAMFDAYRSLLDFQNTLMHSLRTAWGEEIGDNVFYQNFHDCLSGLGKNIFDEIEEICFHQLSLDQSKEGAYII